MLKYIWLDFSKPILPQLPAPFRSAALLFHPFIEMPKWWVLKYKRDDFYPTNEEILQYGTPVTWSRICEICKFPTIDVLLFALMSNIFALSDQFERQDLATQLSKNLPETIFIPNSDVTSPFLWKHFIDLLKSTGSNSLYWTDPIHSQSMTFPIGYADPLHLSQLSTHVLLVSGDPTRFAFMSQYDSFVTVFLSSEESIEPLIEHYQFEAIICDEEI